MTHIAVNKTADNRVWNGIFGIVEQLDAFFLLGAGILNDSNAEDSECSRGSILPVEHPL